MSRKHASLFFVLLIVLSLTSPVWAQSADACKTPYRPNNIFKFLINYTPTLEWIAKASDACRAPFTKDLKKIVRDTWVMSQGCIDVTIEDIELAEKERKVSTKISKRVNAPKDERLFRFSPAWRLRTLSQSGES